MFSIFSVKFSMLDNAEICYGTDVVKKAQNIYQGFFAQIFFDQFHASRIPHIMSIIHWGGGGVSKNHYLITDRSPCYKVLIF